MVTVAKEKVRRNLLLPNELFRRLSAMAERQETSTPDLIKTALKVGLMVLEALQTPGTELVIRDERGERTIEVVV